MQLKHFPLLATFIFLFSKSSFGLSILPDTFNLVNKKSPETLDFLVNSSPDSIIIDSIRISKIKSAGPMQINFLLESGTFPNYRVNENVTIGYSGPMNQIYYSTRKKIIITPFTTVKIIQLNMASCISCPTAKISAQNRIGDTATATIRFYSKNETDSITILTLETPTSIGARPNKSKIHISNKTFFLNGKILERVSDRKESVLFINKKN